MGKVLGSAHSGVISVSPMPQAAPARSLAAVCLLWPPAPQDVFDKKSGADALVAWDNETLTAHFGWAAAGLGAEGETLVLMYRFETHV